MSANDSRITDSGKMAASVFLELRSALLSALQEIDSEISAVLAYRTSKRAAEKARQLFAHRAQVADELSAYGVSVDPHPAVSQ